MRDEFIGRPIEVGNLEWARWFYVYRYYDADDVLLYIGFTSDPHTRWRQHQRNSAWAKDAATVRVERYAYEDLARSAERAAIWSESPLHNIKSTPMDSQNMAAASRERWSAARDSADELRIP